MSQTSVFLFAHQDDEFGAFQKLSDELELGRSVFCVYFTTGAFRGMPFTQRNIESIGVLTKIGVHSEKIIFAGELLDIPDASLPDAMNRSAEWLIEWLPNLPSVSAIYVPAWEGGHHDHDALNVVTTAVAAKLGLSDKVRQFPLYNRYGCFGPFFRVLSPLASNGVAEVTAISAKDRARFLALCLGYPSQTKTWIGLLPFVLMHYLVRGSQSTQCTSLSCYSKPPHPRPLYYEKRGFYSWDKMALRIASFLGKANT